MAESSYQYSVFVDDNYSLPPDEGRYKLGDFASLDEAVAACKRLVDRFFQDEVSHDVLPAKRYEQFTHAGPDPFIVTNDPDASHPSFSAWDYAKKQCEGE